MVSLARPLAAGSNITLSVMVVFDTSCPSTQELTYWGQCTGHVQTFCSYQKNHCFPSWYHECRDVPTFSSGAKMVVPQGKKNPTQFQPIWSHFWESFSQRNGCLHTSLQLTSSQKQGEKCSHGERLSSFQRLGLPHQEKAWEATIIHHMFSWGWVAPLEAEPLQC